MKNPWLEWVAVILLSGALLTGCKTSSAGRQPSDFDGSTAEANVYYYYTEAQLLRARGDHQTALELMHKAMALDPDSRLLKRETAVLYLQLKDNDAALAILEDLIEAHPDDIEALSLLGRLFQGRKQNDEAKAAYARILAQDPHNEDVYLLLGNLYMADEQWDEAYEVFTQFVEYYPDAYAGYYFLGKIYRQQNKPQAAEKAFRRSLEIEPALEGARFELIELYSTDLKQGRYRKRAHQLYEELLEENPQNTRAIFGYALFLRDSGQPRQAENIIRTYAVNIGQNDLIRGVFRYYIEPENNPDAVYLLTHLIALHPNYVDLHYLQGLAFSGLKDHDQALAHFRAVNSQSRFYREATIQIAFRYAEDENHDQAITHLENALKQDPDNPEFMVYLGSFYEEAERYADAERWLLKAIEKTPDSERAYFRLGVVYDKMNRKDESIEAMKQVIALNAEHANALNYLGYTYADLGIHLDEAEMLVRRALKLRPDDGYITDSLGWVYYKQGNYAQALNWLLKAAELAPDDPTILEHVGDAYLKLGNPSQALVHYEKSLSLREDQSEREKIQPKIDALKNASP